MGGYDENGMPLSPMNHLNPYGEGGPAVQYDENGMPMYPNGEMGGQYVVQYGE